MQLELSFAERNLSERKGGVVKCGRNYCRLFKYRPQKIERQVLCHGCGMWDKCPDYEKCLTIKPRKPAPVAYLRKVDEKDENKQG